ncbi:MAG: hypothetical protein IJO98_11065 [Clostridia bacterium]|nr:hypothetical protein [Clostridia bacterium]
MLAENDVFRIYEADRQLFFAERNGSFGKLTPEGIERGMPFIRSASVLRITRLTQAGLEYFVSNFGGSCRVLSLDLCSEIRDFSSLGDLHNLEAIRIEDCRSADQLWDFSGNVSLKVLSLHGAKKIVRDPVMLQTSKTLEEIRLWGAGFDNRHVLSSLACFRGMESLRRIDLNHIRLANFDPDVLSSLPNLEEFHFDAGMLTTEEIACICARYPHLYGESLCAYTTSDVSCLNSVRVCGYRKPGLDLPKDQARLDKYISQFNALVREYQGRI